MSGGKSLEGKAAVVTGSTSGIGLAIAKAFAAEGACVMINGFGDVAAIEDERVCLERDYGIKAVYSGADMSKGDEVVGMIRAAEAAFGKVDILVNNAGASWGAPFDDFPESGWDKVMDLNVKSIFFLTQKLIKPLEAAGTADDYARVINIGSIDGQHVSDLETYSYAASKAGVLHMTRMMAKFLAGRHIAVNAIAPGFFPSKMTAAIPADFSKAMQSETPMQRWGNADDMGGVALFLGSRASAFLCGSVVTVDGGYATTV